MIGRPLRTPFAVFAVLAMTLILIPMTSSPRAGMGLGTLFNAPFEADLAAPAARPKAGIGGTFGGSGQRRF